MAADDFAAFLFDLLSEAGHAIDQVQIADEPDTALIVVRDLDGAVFHVRVSQPRSEEGARK